MSVLYTQLSVEEALARLAERGSAAPNWRMVCDLEQHPDAKESVWAKVKDSKFELGIVGSSLAPPRLSGTVRKNDAAGCTQVELSLYGPLSFAMVILSGQILVFPLTLLLWHEPSGLSILARVTMRVSVALALFPFALLLSNRLFGHDTKRILQFLKESLDASEQPPAGA